METWQLLAGMSVLVVVWVGLVSALGEPPGPIELVAAVLFAAIGIYLGELVSNRLGRRGD